MSFRTRLFQLTLLPIILAVLVLAITLNVFFAQQMNNFIEDKGKSSSTQIAQLIGPLLGWEDLSEEFLYQSVNYSLRASLEETAIRAVRVYDSHGAILAHSGPGFVTPVDQNSPAALTGQIIEGDSATLFTQVVSPPDGGDTLGWVQVEIGHQGFLVKQYQMALVTVGIVLLALGLGVAVTVYSARHTYRPLRQIHRAIEQIGEGDFDIDLDLPRHGAFGELAGKLQNSANYLHQSRQEFIESMEQANEDLRESLDTVEIKNVELNLARKEALEASSAKSEFLANTSHEIRTPLNGILGFTGLLMKTRLTSQQREYLQTIQKSSQGLLALINDILDVSKMEAGQLVLDYTHLNLRNTLEDTLQILAPAAAQKNCQLVPLIQPDTPLHLLGDALRLKQVLTNLVNNAIKFSDHGTIVIRVATEEQSDGRARLRFSVEDQGIGISPQQQRLLFNAFTQADSSHSRQRGGAGLGLTVAKGLIEKMQGEIHVDSTVGEGSVFWFTATLGVDTQAPPAHHALANKRVFVHDPDPAVRDQLTAYLDEWGVKHQKISDQSSLETAAVREAPDCVIWDIFQESNARGWANNNPFIEQLRHDGHTKVILLIKPGCDLDYEEESDDQFILYLHKPVAHDTLYDALMHLTTSAEPAGEPTESTAARPHILAVDDNAANLQLIGELLKDLNNEVTLAQDGEEALAFCRQQNFDLIFMDIQMPGIDGLETTRRLRAQEAGEGPAEGQRTPVVALTAHAMTDQKAELLLAGLDDYLNKPVTEAQLKHVIQRWTQGNADMPPTDDSVGDQTPLTITPQPVDLALSLELSNQKPALARDMLQMLLDDLAEQNEQLTELYRAEDYETLGQRIHKLHGGASYCGVPQLKSVTGKLDQMLQSGEYDSVHHTFTQMLDAIHQLLKWRDEHDLDVVFGVNEPAAHLK